MNGTRENREDRPCPTSGHHKDEVGQVPQSRLGRKWQGWLLTAAGLASLTWFLVRVIPKPSRATYPCQRAAFPLASAFVIWLLGMVAGITAAQKAKRCFRQSRYWLAVTCAAGSILAAGVVMDAIDKEASLAGPLAKKEMPRAKTPVPNKPIGDPKGIHPGRVIWVHDPDATDWQGPGNGHWWQHEHTNQAVVDQMMRRAIQALAGEATDSDAWDRLFRYFNQERGKGDAGYRPGEKVTIKVNFVGFIFHIDPVDPDTYEIEKRPDYMNTSPQMIRALLRQLVNEAGVKQTDIAVGDTLAYFPKEFFDSLHDEFPDVKYLDYEGKAGRVGVKQSSKPFHWSSHPKDCRQDYVPASFAEADYLINLANLKSHTGAGVTLCAKNHYGSLVRWPVEKGYYDLHPSGFDTETGKYRNLVDLMGHREVGGKTLLYLIDGLYAGRHPIDPAPMKWKSAPFNGDWSSSLLASQDPVAIDSVGFDFLWAEWDDFPHKAGADDYLHEAALAANPPSGTFYDPNHAGDVTRLASLGVHEHWNNAQDKQYSGNLGTGPGIELLRLQAPMIRRSSH